MLIKALIGLNWLIAGVAVYFGFLLAEYFLIFIEALVRYNQMGV